LLEHGLRRQSKDTKLGKDEATTLMGRLASLDAQASRSA